jgi:hypothetical protein
MGNPPAHRISLLHQPFYSLEGLVRQASNPPTTIGARIRQHPVVAGLVAAVVVLFVLVVIWPGWGYHWEWTGLGPTNTNGLSGSVEVTQYVPKKALWDWLQLLVVPLAVVVVGYFLNRAQQERIDRVEAQDAALERYLDRVGKMILDGKLRALPKHHSEPAKPETEVAKEIRELAKSETKVLLERLDGPHMRWLMFFLSESGLLRSGTINLGGANLGEAQLRSIHLEGADLGHAHLERAHLEEAHLEGANLIGAHLDGANLTGAHLEEVHREEVHWKGADLTDAHLSGANLSRTHMGCDQDTGTCTNLSNANLTGADLSGAQPDRCQGLDAGAAQEGQVS